MRLNKTIVCVFCFGIALSAQNCFANTQSDVSAYIQEINAGNYAKAEEKIRIALHNAASEFGSLNANTMTITYDLADILLLQGKTAEALEAIETVKSALRSKPELSKAADLDSIDLIHGLSLAATAKDDFAKDKAAKLLENSVSVFDGQERSDAYLLNAYVFLTNYYYEKDNYQLQLDFSNRTIKEITRLFPNGGETAKKLLSDAYFNQSKSYFTDGFKKFGYDGMDPKTGKSLGNKAIKEFGNYDFLLKSASSLERALSSYGKPKNDKDDNFYRLAVWNSFIYSYYETIDKLANKISNKEAIKKELDKAYSAIQNLDGDNRYNCSKFIKFNGNYNFTSEASNKFSFGSALIRFDFDNNNNPTNVYVFGSLPTPVYGEKLKYSLENLATISAKQDIPSECRKNIIYSWRYSTRLWDAPGFK